MTARKWFWSVDKSGRRQPSLIFTFIASPSKPLEDFCRNLAYIFLSMSRCVCPKMISAVTKNLSNTFIALSSDLQELYCQEFVYTILFLTKNIRMTTQGVNTYIYLFITSTGFSKSKVTVFILLSFTC